ncbi:MAG: D-alanine-D-alanine ligase, partial [Pseudohongiellaceae bacterium]
MKRLRILHLSHPWLMPPENADRESDARRYAWKTDDDVVSTLQSLGHEVESLGVEDELRPIQLMVRGFKPDLIFNLVESFAGRSELDHHVVAYLELLRVPYTGCNPRGLMLSKGKALSKKILAYHRIRTPKFAVFPMGRRVRRPRHLEYPVIVKSLIEESSQGISQASVVDTDQKLEDRVAFIHESVGTDAIAEQYIEGRELYVSVIGNQRLTVLPVWELNFGNLPKGAASIATERIKRDLEYQEKRGIVSAPAVDLPEEIADQLPRLTKRVYRTLGLDGYARVDYRLAPDGKLYFLEANPNCEIAQFEELADSAEHAGIPYEKLLSR